MPRSSKEYLYPTYTKGASRNQVKENFLNNIQLEDEIHNIKQTALKNEAITTLVSTVLTIGTLPLSAPLLGLATSVGGIALFLVIHNQKTSAIAKRQSQLDYNIKEVIEWDKLFFNLGIINREDEVPQLIHKENFEGQQSFYFRLPYGIHFESISEAHKKIEHATRSNVHLRYENFKLIIDLIDD